MWSLVYLYYKHWSFVSIFICFFHLWMLVLGSTLLTMATVQCPGRNMQWAQIALAPELTHISDEEWACAVELLFFHKNARSPGWIGSFHYSLKEDEKVDGKLCPHVNVKAKQGSLQKHCLYSLGKTIPKKYRRIVLSWCQTYFSEYEGLTFCISLLISFPQREAKKAQVSFP